MMKLYSNDTPINNSLYEPSMTTSISDLTDENGINKSYWKNVEPNYDPKYLTKVISDSVTISTKLNISTGRAANIASRRIHDHCICEAREANKRLTKKRKLARKKLEDTWYPKINCHVQFQHNWIPGWRRLP